MSQWSASSSQRIARAQDSAQEVVRAAKTSDQVVATAMAVPHLPEHDRFQIGPPCPQAVGPIGIIGPGTGLGMSALIPNGREWVLVAGEGGHATLPAASPEAAWSKSQTS